MWNYEGIKEGEMNEISILTPTRERVEMCERMIQSVIDTVNHPERIELCFHVDWDDPQHENYLEMFKKYKDNPCQLIYSVDEPMSVSKSWNLIAEYCSGDILKMGNDDIIYQTKGWDDKLDEEVKKFPDYIYVIWFNDGKRRKKLSTFPIVSRKWYDVLGYFTPGVFEFYYNDTWIWDIARQLDRLHYLDHISMPHLHKGTSPEQKATMVRDSEVFHKLADQRAEDVAKLRGVMNGIH